ncbi:hypothetical protein [Fodinibacter luteus]|uniref:HNH endonuclease signature motif containing protein n=1 Tax=Fodinibacter luteus TaxID=552064 RepID=UPI0031F0EFFA
MSAVQDVAVVAVSRREGVWGEDGTLGEVVLGAGRVSVDAADVLAPALGASHAQAQRRVEAAVRLAGGCDPVPAGSGQVPQASGLGGLHAAMAAGVLDSYRASVVAAELVDTPAPVAQAVVAALAGHWGEDGTDLRRRTRRLLARICPDLLRQRAVRARAECGLRRWVAEPGVDTWLGSFPSEDAATAWAAVDQLAHRYVAEGVCAGVEAARGKALTDLVTGNATIDVQVVLTVPADALPADTVPDDPAPADPTPSPAPGTDGTPDDETAAGQAGSPAVDGEDEDENRDATSRTTAPDAATPAHVPDRPAGADLEADAAADRADAGVPATAPHAAASGEASTTSTHDDDDDHDDDHDDHDEDEDDRDAVADDRDAVADGGGAGARQVGDAVAEAAGAASGPLSGAGGGGRGGDLVQVQGCRPSEPLLVPRAWLLEHLARGSSGKQPGPRHRRRRRRDGTPDRAGPTSTAPCSTAPVPAPVIEPRVVPCDPVSGARVDPGQDLASGAYRPSPALAALVRARDGRCRFPGCAVAARFCDLDHARAWPGGPTTAENLMVLCRRHHRVKQTPGWVVRLHPDATTTWTDPTGTVRTTHPLDALAVLVLRHDDHDSTAGFARATGNPGTGHSHSHSHSHSGSGRAAGHVNGQRAAGDGAVLAGAWSALQTHLELALEHHPPPPHSFTVRPTHPRRTSTVLRAALARRRARTRFPDEPPF